MNVGEDYITEIGVARILEGIYVEHLKADERGRRTIVAMSFVARELLQKKRKNILESFDREFGPDYYTYAVYVGTIATGSVDFFEELFQRKESYHYALAPVAIVGITIYHFYNSYNGIYNSYNYEIQRVYPVHLFDEDMVLRTLQLLVDMSFNPQIIMLMIEFSELEHRSTPFREHAIVIWTNAMTSHELRPLLHTFSDDDAVLIKTIDYGLVTGKVDVIKFEAILALTRTSQISVMYQIILVIKLIRNQHVPICKLYPSSIKRDISIYVRIWGYIEQMKDKQINDEQ
jgi:hypothetical protein